MLAGFAAAVYAIEASQDFKNPDVHFWVAVLGDLALCSMAFVALGIGIHFLDVAWTGRDNPIHGWMRLILLGIGMFFPGFRSEFVLWAACGALSQREGPSADLLQRDSSTSPEAQRQEMREAGSLPDAPSTVQPPTQAEKFQTFVDQARSPLTLGAVGINAGAMRETKMRETKLGYVTPGLQPSFTGSL